MLLVETGNHASLDNVMSENRTMATVLPNATDRPDFSLRMISTVLMVACALFATDSNAEGNCPSGYYPIGGGSAGWEGCAPGSTEETDPVEEWESRWGAIATGDGLFGAHEGASSKSRAEKLALRQCQGGQKGRKCKIKVFYHDQCAALAWGDGGAIAFRSPDKSDAEQSAVAACSQHTTDCELYYSACSYPERIR